MGKWEVKFYHSKETDHRKSGIEMDALLFAKKNENQGFILTLSIWAWVELDQR